MQKRSRAIKTSEKEEADTYGDLEFDVGRFREAPLPHLVLCQILDAEILELLAQHILALETDRAARVTQVERRQNKRKERGEERGTGGFFRWRESTRRHSRCIRAVPAAAARHRTFCSQINATERM